MPGSCQALYQRRARQRKREDVVIDVVQPAPVLRGERVVLRAARRSDAEGLAAILREPDVARWWLRGADPDGFAEELVQAQDDVVFAIEHDGELVGAVQYYEETDPDYRHAGIDIFLTSRLHGRGLGPETLRVLARYLFDQLGHHRLVIDPAADNERAIRAYERLGFRPVGLMREYERGPADTWHDGLLMDLLAAELR